MYFRKRNGIFDTATSVKFTVAMCVEFKKLRKFLSI